MPEYHSIPIIAIEQTAYSMHLFDNRMIYSLKISEFFTLLVIFNTTKRIQFGLVDCKMNTD